MNPFERRHLELDERISPVPWSHRKATRSVGRSMRHHSLYDADGRYITGGFSLAEADLIVDAMNSACVPDGVCESCGRFVLGIDITPGGGHVLWGSVPDECGPVTT